MYGRFRCGPIFRSNVNSITVAAIAVGGSSFAESRVSTSASTAVTTRVTTEWMKKASTTSRRLFGSSSSSSSSSSNASSTGGGFVQWYEGHLERAPVRTKMVTGSILWGLGDVVAQVVPQVATTVSSSGTKTDESSGSSSKEQQFQYDYIRTARASFFGLAIHAPLSHVHYNFLEWMTIRTGLTGYSIPIFKTVMEQFVYWSWISNSIYHGAMEILQTMTIDPSKIYDRIVAVLWDTQKAQWVFWIPIQLLNFQYIPVRHQLNVVLLTSVVWTALLSAWYPPTPPPQVELDPSKTNSK